LYAGLCAIALVPPAGCLQAGCVRNSDCVAADWCIDTKCVPRPVDGGVSESDAGAHADAAAMSSDAAAGASTSRFIDAGSSKPDAANDAGGGKDASASSDAVPQM
jgi:hypothetical protein